MRMRIVPGSFWTPGRGPVMAGAYLLVLSVVFIVLAGWFSRKEMAR